MKVAERRIREYFQSWFLTEPILFQCINTHKLSVNNKIKTIRVGKGYIEYNEHFINDLSENDLRELLIFEGMRILCKHPYERKKPNPIANMVGSNVTIQEYLSTHLEMPNANKMFDHLLEKNRTKSQEAFLNSYNDLSQLEEHELEKLTGMNHNKLKMIRDSVPSMSEEELNKRHFEFYYKLIENNIPEMITSSIIFSNMKDKVQEHINGEPSKSDEEQTDEEQTDGTISDHFDPLNSFEQQSEWGEDELLKNEINNNIKEAQLNSQNWGSVPSHMQKTLIASLKPKVDYRGILKKFRASIISSNTRMNRMRPSRRFGFGAPGKKRDFTTKLAVFVDVSASMTDETLSKGFSIINKFFKYGIKSVDVYQFDTELRNEGKPISMDKAHKKVKLLGRGGTDFQIILNKLAETSEYDGVIVYTDGECYKPKVPSNMKTKVKNILWLFDKEHNYKKAYKNLTGVGKTAFVRSDREY